jgi:hypothetical protein
MAKYVVGLADRVSPTDIEEGMRVGVDRQNKFQIHIPLPPKIDPSVTMMTVEEKPGTFLLSTIVVLRWVGSCFDGLTEQMLHMLKLVVQLNKFKRFVKSSNFHYSM